MGITRDIALITKATVRTMEGTIHVLMCGNRDASVRRCRFATRCILLNDSLTELVDFAAHGAVASKAADKLGARAEPGLIFHATECGGLSGPEPWIVRTAIG